MLARTLRWSKANSCGGRVRYGRAEQQRGERTGRRRTPSISIHVRALSLCFLCLPSCTHPASAETGFFLCLFFFCTSPSFSPPVSSSLVSRLSSHRHVRVHGLLLILDVLDSLADPQFDRAGDVIINENGPPLQRQFIRYYDRTIRRAREVELIFCWNDPLAFVVVLSNLPRIRYTEHLGRCKEGRIYKPILVMVRHGTPGARIGSETERDRKSEYIGDDTKVPQ